MYIDKPYLTNEFLLKSASPIAFIDSDSSPILLIHSTGDGLLSFGQSTLTIEKY